jgi:hypothetical protein
LDLTEVSTSVSSSKTDSSVSSSKTDSSVSSSESSLSVVSNSLVQDLSLESSLGVDDVVDSSDDTVRLEERVRSLGDVAISDFPGVLVVTGVLVGDSVVVFVLWDGLYKYRRKYDYIYMGRLRLRVRGQIKGTYIVVMSVSSKSKTPWSSDGSSDQDGQSSANLYCVENDKNVLYERFRFDGFE